METDFWRQVEDLFEAAQALPADQRARFLEQAPDSRLRNEVQSLLNVLPAAGSFLDRSPISSAEPRPYLLTQGQRLGNFEILEPIGRGGMGEVYRANDLRLGRCVAIKVLLAGVAELIGDAKALERFEQEARATSALDHPNICSIYEIRQESGHAFLVMQLLEGQTLRDRMLNVAAPLPVAELVGLATQIANGLAEAHRKGIVHRDIKPANIFVTSRGQAKILDFGLARLEQTRAFAIVSGEATPAVHSSLTLTGAAMGTAAYMSPEQLRRETLDARTDLYSFGLVLYEMATGQTAFARDTAADVQHAIINDAAVPAREINHNLPRKLAEIIDKALLKDREVRYQSAEQICSDLESISLHSSPLLVGWGGYCGSGDRGITRLELLVSTKC